MIQEKKKVLKEQEKNPQSSLPFEKSEEKELLLTLLLYKLTDPYRPPILILIF